MKRDSVFDEPVLWSGRPKVIATPLMCAVGAVVCGVAKVMSASAAGCFSSILTSMARGGGFA